MMPYLKPFRYIFQIHHFFQECTYLAVTPDHPPGISPSAGDPDSNLPLILLSRFCECACRQTTCFGSSQDGHKWWSDITPPFISAMKFSHLEGERGPILRGQQRSLWLLATFVCPGMILQEVGLWGIVGCDHSTYVNMVSQPTPPN